MKLNKLLGLCGNVLAIAGIIFLILRFRTYAGQLSEIALSPSFIFVSFILAWVSGLSVVLLVIAWKKILCANGQQVNLKTTLVIYGLSQLAKYIPGNVFQFAGRQLVAMRYNLQARPVAKSIAMELLLLVFCGCAFTTLMLPHFFSFISSAISIGLFLAMVALVFCALFYNANIFTALIFQCLYLVITGMLFYTIFYCLNAASVTGFSAFMTVTTAFIVAWLFGLITPGAPAGIGVREAVLVMLLIHLPQSEVIVAALLSRIITLAGDVLFYLFSVAAKRGLQ